MIRVNQQCAKVEGGAVVAVDTFAVLIKPASTFKGGFPADRAAAEFGVYPIERKTPTAKQKSTDVDPYFEGGAVYSNTVSSKTVAERRVEMKETARAKALARQAAGTTATIGGQTAPVSSVPEAADRLLGAIRHMTATSSSSMYVVMTSGAAVTMTLSDVNAALTAIDALYAACEAWQNAKFTAIDAATTQTALNAIDLDAGLPS